MSDPPDGSMEAGSREVNQQRVGMEAGIAVW
jgi:hypothetical protein